MAYLNLMRSYLQFEFDIFDTASTVLLLTAFLYFGCIRKKEPAVSTAIKRTLPSFFPFKFHYLLYIRQFNSMVLQPSSAATLNSNEYRLYRG